MTDGSLKSKKWQKGFAKKGFCRSFSANWTRVLACNSLLLGLNLISFIIGLLIVFLVGPMFSSAFTIDGLRTFLIENNLTTAEAATEEAVNAIFYLLSLCLSMMLTGMILVVNGPFYTAVCYYFKNLLVGDGSFKSDFKSGLKENWKKSLGAMLISIFVTTIVLFNIGYYQQVGLGLLGTLAKCFFLTVLVFWAAMQIYVYPLIASVELRFRDVYRNAAGMVVKNWLSSFGLVFLEFVLFGLLPFILVFLFSTNGYAIITLLYLVFSFGFICFCSVYLTWKAVQKIITANE